MDQSIEQLARDLAFAGYAKHTQERYVRTAEELADRIRKPFLVPRSSFLVPRSSFLGQRYSGK